MRDINALNRSRTFVEEWSENSIIIDKNKFAYYCYVDVFKEYIGRLPYYYGNCDVFINNNDFIKIKDVFITKSIEKHPWLKSKIEYSNKKTQSLMMISEKEHPCAVQIFGCEPDTMAQSALEAVKCGADIIDINMGCPAPKIVNNGCGSALMKSPALCGSIVKAVSGTVDIPTASAPKVRNARISAGVS